MSKKKTDKAEDYHPHPTVDRSLHSIQVRLACGCTKQFHTTREFIPTPGERVTCYIHGAADYEVLEVTL